MFLVDRTFTSSKWRFFISWSLLGLLYLVVLYVRRVYFHPLSKFPGPRLAALSRWYEFYFDVIKGGTLIKQFPALHQQYGSIVRISPEQLHVNDPEFYREVYNQQTNYFKAPYFYQGFGLPGSLLFNLDPNNHRIQRKVLNPMFSAQSMDRMSAGVGDKVEQAVCLMERSRGKPLDIQALLRCINADIMIKILTGSSSNFVGSNDPCPPLLTTLNTFINHGPLMKQFPLLPVIALQLPSFLSGKLVPGYVQFRKDCAIWIKNIAERREKGVTTDDDGNSTLLDVLLEPSPDKSYEVPAMKDLIDHTFTFVGAGVDTTAYTLSFAIFYILRNEGVLEKLRKELHGFPRDTSGRFEWKHVSNLPYLTAVFRESLRLSSVVPGILPRVVPSSGCYVGERFIPAGTIVSISHRTIHDNPTLFPEPEKFIPERWLGEKGKELEKWHVSFSKGPRHCIGMNLVYLIGHLSLANFFGRLSMELFETDESSMEWLDRSQAMNKSNVKVRVKPLAV